MRRFIFIVFALAVLFTIVTGRKDPSDRRDSDRLSAADEKKQEPAVAAPTATPPGQDTVHEHSETRDAILKTAAIIETLPNTTEKTAQADYVKFVPEHIAAGRIDPALEGLTGGDLNVVLQSELKRLGCYSAQVDGIWGRMSRAAVKAFKERAGGDWGDSPKAELAAALRNYPAAFCTAECTARTPDGQCAVAALPTGRNDSADAGRDTSYLPPWMQGVKLSNIEQGPAAAPGDQKTVTDAAPSILKRKKTKSVRRREEGRAAQRYERERYESRRFSSVRDWLPDSWPGTAR